MNFESNCFSYNSKTLQFLSSKLESEKREKFPNVSQGENAQKTNKAINFFEKGGVNKHRFLFFAQ
jgi:hypothetical protein